MTKTKAVFATLLSAAALAWIPGSPARADLIVNIQQVGSDVVATGSGTLDLAGLTFDGTTTVAEARVQPDAGLIALGSSAATDGYTGFTGPTSFGIGGNTNASSETGVRATIQGTNTSPDLGANVLFVPNGYVSGDPLSDTAVFANTTLADLGLTDGTYTWTWDDPSDPDVISGQFVVNVGTVPEPGSLPLLVLPLAALMLFRWLSAPRTKVLSA
jgi:hypothetical protein